MPALSRTLLEQYRCPDNFFTFELRGELSRDVGFFRYGPCVLYGHSASGSRQLRPVEDLYDVAGDVKLDSSTIRIPFDPSEMVENLRLERYAATEHSWSRSISRRAYYRFRPFLHRSLRESIQKFQLRGWRQRSFPSWPVDFTVESFHEQLLLLALQASGAERIPFIWFWPDGAEACAIMTHDVEGESGKNFCTDLMAIDDAYGIKAAFQMVPQGSYQVSEELASVIRDRGFEVGIQDLNHDGRLYDEREEFLRRADLINEYGRKYKAKGFRGGVLYRKPEWYDALDFLFDMSIPNTAHLDPQRGGCCTVMPYFIGGMLELPVTTTQDYMLFHLLSERSIELWKTQIDMILSKNGLISFIVHPDYVIAEGPRATYRDLLSYLRDLRASRNIWMTLPSDVDRWWRQRSKMRLVNSGAEWRIEGDGAERAIIAYAINVNGKLVYELQSQLTHSASN